MWRHNSFSEIHDSDQSISDDDDEEEQGRKWSENYVSLAGTSDCKKRDSGFLSEDEVEAPDFYKRNLDCENNVECDSIIIKAGGSTCDPNERISSVKKGRNIFSKSIKEGNNVSEMLDLYTKGNEKQFEPCTSSEVDKEARRMGQLSERARWSTCHPFNSKNKNLGGRCKIKKKSSSLQPQKQVELRSVWKDKDLNSSSDDELHDKAEPSGYQPIDKISPVLLGGSDVGTSSLALPLEAAIEHDNHRRSMAELLDNLQGNTSNPILKPKKGSRRKGRGKRAVIRSMTLPGKDLVSDEDPCEVMHSGSSTDNEDNAQNLALAIVESGRKSMADKFQEAFDCASVVDKRPSFTALKQSSTGLFGRLLHMMQQQKEQDADFLKKVQTEVWPKDEARCIDVKILSRSFDAKLSVCSCSLIENEESSLQNPQQENFGKIWTVIFNSRVCGDVNLDIGNLIRIYPPWKEVQVLKGGEIIILTLYFSQFHT
uniref:Uncharacterized protein n=1 Tax=Chenopodium quinoa TaxID=63459 RepID=A0A803MPI3_CHEQI